MKRIRVLSGVPASEPGGTARFLRHLVEDGERLSEPGWEVAFEYRPSPFRQRRKKWTGVVDSFVPFDAKVPIELIEEENLLIFHPQALGYRFTHRLLQARKHTWHFILDSSYFCRRSYNHLPGERSACLACADDGPKMASRHGCPVFPWVQGGADSYSLGLREAGARISYLVQSRSSGELLRRVVGDTPRVEVVGMAADFDLELDREVSIAGEPNQIVFHGNPLSAKGYEWTLELAACLPEKTFLFPFGRPSGSGSTGPNCRFQPMTWETGLREAVATSGAVLCPSLWSAPIEGAFVKSLIHGHVVGTVEVPTTTSIEYGGDPLAVALSPDPAKAAIELEATMRQAWSKEVWNLRRSALGELIGARSEGSQLVRILEKIFA